MKTIIRSALACAFLGFLGVPAGAATLFQLSGSVGDQHWQIIGDGQYYVLDVAAFFPDQGPETFGYSGATLLGTEDTYSVQTKYADFTCLDMNGCVYAVNLYENSDQWTSPVSAPSHAGVSSYSDTLDSTNYANLSNYPFQIPSEVPFGWSYNWSANSVVSYDFYDVVSPDEFGQAFSITVSADDPAVAEVASAVPESTTWAMMLIGFSLIGLSRRAHQGARPLLRLKL